MNYLSRTERIKTILANLHQPAFRLNQILRAIYLENILDYGAINNLPLKLRETLTEELGEVLTLRVGHVSQGTIADKLLFYTRDGQAIESVITKVKPFVCLSSMSGCNLGCKFCSTGTMGLLKKLTVEEIIDQVLYFQANYNFHGHITFMGMGEPFFNCEAVFPALKILLEDLHYAQRKISLSTVGIVPGIIRLTEEFPQVNLALSLHSAIEAQRAELMPVNKLYPLTAVMPAINQYLAKTNRKVFLAYLLLDNLNDSSEHAKALVQLIKAQGKFSYLYHVNLIQYHESVSESRFRRSSADRLAAFSDYLTKNTIPNTVRKSFGEDIQAACGQLYAKINRLGR